MSYLLDVSLLAAFAWRTHERYHEANVWVFGLPRFFTCAATQMGFLRVSMSAGYGTSYAKARSALASIASLEGHAFLTDETTAASLPELTSRGDVTDAHLVTLAKKNSLKLATLDEKLCRAPWTGGVAIYPLSVIQL